MYTKKQSTKRASAENQKIFKKAKLKVEDLTGRGIEKGLIPGCLLSLLLFMSESLTQKTCEYSTRQRSGDRQKKGMDVDDIVHTNNER